MYSYTYNGYPTCWKLTGNLNTFCRLGTQGIYKPMVTFVLLCVQANIQILGHVWCHWKQHGDHKWRNDPILCNYSNHLTATYMMTLQVLYMHELFSCLQTPPTWHQMAGIIHRLRHQAIKHGEPSFVTRFMCKHFWWGSSLRGLQYSCNLYRIYNHNMESTERTRNFK